MKHAKVMTIVLAAFVVMAGTGSAAPNQISYQGSLADSNGDPVVDSAYSLTFRIYYEPTNNLLWTENQVVTTTSGQFSAELGSVTPIPDSIFSLDNLELGITINPDPELSPRTPLNTVPYSYRVQSVDRSTGGQISGSVELLPTEPDTVGNALKVVNSNGELLMTITNENVGAFTRGGEIVALARMEFYDPIDSKTGLAAADAAEVSLSKDGLILFGPTEADTIVTIARRRIVADVGKIILGRDHVFAGDSSAIGGGYSNTITAVNNATISGGIFNEVSANSGTVGGGRVNNVFARYGTIGGGLVNDVGGVAGTVAGGQFGEALGRMSTIGGGSFNHAHGAGSVVCGGGGDTLQTPSDSNSAQGHYSAILGGQRNYATGNYGVIAGGLRNEANLGSFAAGTDARANEQYSFVWGDGSQVTTAIADFSFTVRATGGTRFYSDTIGSGVYLAPGGGSWQTLSDSTMKKNIREVDYDDVLNRLEKLPINQWSYKSQDPSVEHIGPTAQEFHDAFGLGEDDRRISTLDPDGVALAAIKALNEKVDKLSEENARLKQLLEKLLSEQDN